MSTRCTHTPRRNSPRRRKPGRSVCSDAVSRRDQDLRPGTRRDPSSPHGARYARVRGPESAKRRAELRTRGHDSSIGSRYTRLWRRACRGPVRSSEGNATMCREACLTSPHICVRVSRLSGQPEHSVRQPLSRRVTNRTARSRQSALPADRMAEGAAIRRLLLSLRIPWARDCFGDAAMARAASAA